MIKSRLSLVLAAAALLAACASSSGVVTGPASSPASSGSTSPSTPSTAASSSSPSTTVPTQVAGKQLSAFQLKAGGTLQLQVGGQAGVPGDALAVAMNVTVTNPSAAGFVTVWPCGQPQPVVSNLNYVAGQNVPNLAISRLGTNGQICFFSLVATDLIADVSGYFPPSSDFKPIDNPVRILDTRNGTGAAKAKVPAGGTLQLQVGNQAGVPADAMAVAMNVTVTNPAAAGYVTVWPCGQPQPLVSNLNYVAGQTVPNLTISRVGAGGKVCFFSLAATDLIADVSGYFPVSTDFTPIDNPARILDTRNGTGGGARLGQGGVFQLAVGGSGANVPGNALAVAMNVTVTNPAAAGYVTVWPCGQPQPLASNLNYVTGQNVPNLTISRLGDGREGVLLLPRPDRSRGRCLGLLPGRFRLPPDHQPRAHPRHPQRHRHRRRR